MDFQSKREKQYQQKMRDVLACFYCFINNQTNKFLLPFILFTSTIMFLYAFMLIRFMP